MAQRPELRLRAGQCDQWGKAFCVPSTSALLCVPIHSLGLIPEYLPASQARHLFATFYGTVSGAHPSP